MFSVWEASGQPLERGTLSVLEIPDVLPLKWAFCLRLCLVRDKPRITPLTAALRICIRLLWLWCYSISDLQYFPPVQLVFLKFRRLWHKRCIFSIVFRILQWQKYRLTSCSINIVTSIETILIKLTVSSIFILWSICTWDLKFPQRWVILWCDVTQSSSVGRYQYTWRNGRLFLSVPRWWKQHISIDVWYSKFDCCHCQNVVSSFLCCVYALQQ